ncbi:trigger factor [Candidatus Comchoanobacter bicostacola]|uniref:Trigger factor n=1 Tax=Candidatus Comchoanobacter bicostacola TaxID=2919598 RepID=A0ABY5DI90_9GAMM|nr:trigger factor [Candidatus Comchoanobacter bicostacola]UTC24333.1 trigger factor [Candidatus Comchoanobacter bicostacola]
MVQKKTKSILDSSSVKINEKGNDVTISLTLSVADVEKEYKKAFKKVASQTKISGFRKGKGSKLIESRNGPQIRAEAVEKLIDQEIKSVIKEFKHDVASTPTATDSKGDGVSSDIVMTVGYEVFLSLPDVDLKKIKVSGVEGKISESDVSEEIARIQKHHADWKVVDAQSQQGSRLKIDFMGKIDGELFEGGSAADQFIELGAKQYLPEFEQALEGVEKGKTVKFDVNFPEDYQGKEVAGKKAVFEVNVHEVQEKEAKALNKEFYKQAGYEAGTKPQFENEVKSRLEADTNYLAEAVNRRRLVEALQKSVKVSLPASVVQKELEHAKTSSPDEKEKVLKAQVESNLSKVLVIKHFMQKMNVQLSQEDLVKHIELMAPPQVAKEMFVQWYAQDKERLQQAQSTLLEQKTLSALLPDVTLTKKSVTIAEIEKELKE